MHLAVSGKNRLPFQLELLSLSEAQGLESLDVHCFE